MTHPLLIANWKMNLPPEGIEAYCAAVSVAGLGGIDVFVAPPFPFLSQTAECAASMGIRVAAQDCSDARSGAFTGEVSAEMVAGCGGRAVIIGHSERRARWGEDERLIGDKMSRAREAGLLPILCIGESLEIRESGGTAAFLSAQLSLPAGTFAGMRHLVIAYEPVWAVGTGRHASGRMVAETRGMIEARLRLVADRGAAISVLYGGSVTPENVDELVDEGHVDGFLVGGASLMSSKCIGIARSLARRAERASGGGVPRA